MKILNHTLAALAIAMLTACSSSDKKAAQADSVADETPNVEVLTVHEETVARLGEYTATLEAFKTNNITTSTPNRIKSITVDVGSHVARGQRLVTLDDVNTTQLKVRLDNTEREFRRAEELLKIGAGTRQQVDQLKTELDAARRQYSNMVENTILVSPISGVVTARNYDPGDMTGAQPILTIEQVQPLKVVIHVSESEFPLVKRGMSADIVLDVLPDQHLTGTVSLIHPSVDAATRTFTVEITIPNAGEKVVPGMFARVTLNFGEASHVVVPDRAVVKQPGSGNRYVYVYDPRTKTVSYNRVELGRRMGESYELLSGVDNNSMVVISGQTRLANGVKVNVITKK